ncbi:MAG: NIPSNAP family protein, partial [Pseudomonadota bacterium]|nr:NIPSNAP family protein [Pseudomonadota bacterium]
LGWRLNNVNREDGMAFYELRQYKIQDGKMDAWLKIMEEEIIPFQCAQGMVICASFRGEEDDSVYFWIRRFESEAARAKLYAAVYESDYWKNDVAPRVGELIDRSATVVQRVTATRMSPLQ